MYNLLHYCRVKCLNGKVFSRYSLILCCFALKNIKNTILIIITIKLSKATDGKSSCFFKIMLMKGLKLQCLDRVSITHLRQMMKIGQFCFFHEHDIWKTKKKKKNMTPSLCMPL